MGENLIIGYPRMGKGSPGIFPIVKELSNESFSVSARKMRIC